MSKTVNLQPDDQDLLHLLGATFLILDERQVTELFPDRSPRAFRARMAKLAGAGFINIKYPGAVFQPARTFYYLGPLGQKILDPDSSNPKIASRLRQARDFSDAELTHLYLATWAQIKFMAARRDYRDYELVTWIPQYAPVWAMLNRHGLAVRPDGFVRYTKDGRTMHAFIEVDRNTYRSQLRKKFDGYHRYAESGRSADHLSAPDFRVLFITESERHMKALRRIASSYPGHLFWIATIKELLSNELFEPLWIVPSSSSLHALDEPAEPLPRPPDPPYAPSL